MAVYEYPTTEDLLSEIPQIPYRNGVGAREGVVIHYTGTANDNAADEHAYESSHWQTAFVHEFIDPNTCLVQASKDYACWGAGPHANQRFYQIEMCDAKTQADFDAIYDRTCSRVAYIMYQDELVPADDDTVRSHYEISLTWPDDTDHTDPVDYLKKWGKSWEDMVNQIIAYYNQICYDNSNPTPEPTPTPDPTPTTTVDKDAATKVIGVLGELYDIAGDDKIKTALHTAADALRDASGIPKQS